MFGHAENPEIKVATYSSYFVLRARTLTLITGLNELRAFAEALYQLHPKVSHAGNKR